MSTLVKSKTPAETLETLLKLVRHSEADFFVRDIKDSNGNSNRLEVEFSNGVRYDIAIGAYGFSVDIYGPAPRTVYILEMKIAGIALATRVFETENQRADFIAGVPEEHKQFIETREEEVK